MIISIIGSGGKTTRMKQLLHQYKEEGKKFIPQYKHVLSAGGSESPEDILTDEGFNFYDPTFWQGGFDFLTEKMMEIERN